MAHELSWNMNTDSHLPCNIKVMHFQYKEMWQNIHNEISGDDFITQTCMWMNTNWKRNKQKREIKKKCLAQTKIKRENYNGGKKKISYKCVHRKWRKKKKIKTKEKISLKAHLSHAKWREKQSTFNTKQKRAGHIQNHIK